MLDAKHLLCRRGGSRSGQSLVEFTLLGVPMLFITISVIGISIDMWQYHTLAYATEMTARMVSVHGATCASTCASGQTCTIEVEDVAKFFATQSIALNPSTVVVTMTDSSGTTTCNPVNTCNTTTAQFPAATANSVGSDITITATYTLSNPFAMLWPQQFGASGQTVIQSAHDYTGGAKSRQRIVF